MFRTLTIALALITLPAIGFAQQASDPKMPSDNVGDRWLCPENHRIGIELGYKTCLRDGNVKLSIPHNKYGFLRFTSANGKVDGVCLGIVRSAASDSVVDDRFISDFDHADGAVHLMLRGEL